MHAASRSGHSPQYRTRSGAQTQGRPQVWRSSGWGPGRVASPMTSWLGRPVPAWSHPGVGGDSPTKGPSPWGVPPGVVPRSFFHLSWVPHSLRRPRLCCLIPRGPREARRPCERRRADPVTEKRQADPWALGCLRGRALIFRGAFCFLQPWSLSLCSQLGFLPWGRESGAEFALRSRGASRQALLGGGRVPPPPPRACSPGPD